jgi:hypothetical protein
MFIHSPLQPKANKGIIRTVNRKKIIFSQEAFHPNHWISAIIKPEKAIFAPQTVIQ